MVDQTLVERKVETSFNLAARIADAGEPLLAAYWEWQGEKGRWELYLVPNSLADERRLINVVSNILTETPYRSAFSFSDVVIDGHLIDRARAIGAYIRRPEDIGRRFDTTFTSGHYFESVIVVYLSPELAQMHHAV